MHRDESYGPTVLRVALGVVFMAHAWLKVVVFTIPGTVAFFESIGLPGPLAYGVIVAEALGGAMLVLGIQVREVALVLAAISFGASWAHAGNGWLFTNQGGGWEYPVLLAVATFAQALMGAGAMRLPVPEFKVVAWAS